MGHIDTIKGIREIKQCFEKELEAIFGITWVPSPLVYSTESGINDYLNNDTPVEFKIKAFGDKQFEVLQSISKWKRMALMRYGFKVGEGLYSDFTSLRPNEPLDNIHSIAIDQWGWEVVLTKEQRTIETLKSYVTKLFNVYQAVQKQVLTTNPDLIKVIPEELKFITSEELLQRYPDKNSIERINAITEEYKAVFIIGIGHKLSNGESHEGRAPDYDDWNLNGDLYFWNPVLKIAFEMTSMGIRVDADSLKEQLGDDEIKPFHELIFDNKLPLCIGGGIGSSRAYMLFLNKERIDEVQLSPVMSMKPTALEINILDYLC